MKYIYTVIVLVISWDSAFLDSSPSELLRCEKTVWFCTGLAVCESLQPEVLSLGYQQQTSCGPHASRKVIWNKCRSRHGSERQWVRSEYSGKSEVHVEWGLVWPIRAIVQNLKETTSKFRKKEKDTEGHSGPGFRQGYTVWFLSYD